MRNVQTVVSWTDRERVSHYIFGDSNWAQTGFVCQVVRTEWSLNVSGGVLHLKYVCSSTPSSVHCCAYIIHCHVLIHDGMHVARSNRAKPKPRQCLWE